MAVVTKAVFDQEWPIAPGVKHVAVIVQVMGPAGADVPLDAVREGVHRVGAKEWNLLNEVLAGHEEHRALGVGGDELVVIELLELDALVGDGVIADGDAADGVVGGSGSRFIENNPSPDPVAAPAREFDRHAEVVRTPLELGEFAVIEIAVGAI